MSQWSVTLAQARLRSVRAQLLAVYGLPCISRMMEGGFVMSESNKTALMNAHDVELVGGGDGGRIDLGRLTRCRPSGTCPAMAGLRHGVGGHGG